MWNQQKKVNFIIFFKLYLGICSHRISVDFYESRALDLYLYEVRIDLNFNKEIYLINEILYECQCALFLIDITNNDSFILIKDLIKADLWARQQATAIIESKKR